LGDCAARNGIQPADRNSVSVCLAAQSGEKLMSYRNPLTIAEIQERVSELEAKYDATTRDFVGNHDVRARVSEDDVLMWETYIAFRRELINMDERTHRRYLDTIDHHSQKSASTPAVIEYAA
jgi:hypothetical protein